MCGKSKPLVVEAGAGAANCFPLSIWEGLRWEYATELVRCCDCSSCCSGYSSIVVVVVVVVAVVVVICETEHGIPHDME